MGRPCPVCGKPRGKGAFEFAHGPCMDTQAKQEVEDLQRKAMPDAEPESLRRLTKAHVRSAKDKKTRNKYLKGKLPPWMLS